MQKTPQKSLKKRIFGVAIKINELKYPNKMLQLSLFSEEMKKSVSYLRFEMTELGQLHQQIPFEKLAALFPQKKKIGRKSILTLEGGIALMFLKSYTSLSDEKLVENLNANWMYQLFCGVQFGKHFWINDKDFVGRWRRALSKHLNVSVFQKTLLEDWKKDIPHKETVLMDATCYESYIRYPTDAKLLWESCEWVYDKLYKLCTRLKKKRPRFKYVRQKNAYLDYAKTRKKTHKKTQKIKKKLLYLLNQGLQKLLEYRAEDSTNSALDIKFENRLKVVCAVLEQQKELYETGETDGSKRIVSLAKPYIRPIKRGKETRPTEFGMKAHIIQVGGISLVEYLSFNAFHEGNRLEPTVLFHEQCFQKVQMLGGDKIYGTKSNRNYCKSKNITTSFVPLGRKPKDAKKSEKKVVRDALNKERSTALEGAFGNHKNHYNLSKVKAKTEKTEILWIVFGIWTASAMKMAKIRAQKEASTTSTQTQAA